MMKKNNKKGFTLIELIVVIAIVAALSVTLGVSSVQTMKDTKLKENREMYDTLFSAAVLYSKLKKPIDTCNSGGVGGVTCSACTIPASSTGSNDKCTVPLCCLVSSGLLDEVYYTKIDTTIPESEETRVFRADKEITIYYYNYNLYARIVLDTNFYLTNEESNRTVGSTNYYSVDLYEDFYGK